MLVRLRIVTTLFLFWVGFFLAARTAFLVYHDLGVTLGTGGVLEAFRAGLRLDLSAAAYLTVVPLVAVVLSSFGRWIGFARRVVWTWLIVALVGGCLLIAIDLEIVNYWGRRVDAAIVPYLRTLPEAWASAGLAPRGALLLGTALSVTLLLGVLHRLLRPLAALTRGEPLSTIPLTAMLGGLFLLGRGGFGTWPLTVSSAYHSDQPAANLLAQNALWGFFDSAYRRVYDRSNPFQRMTPGAADSVVAAARASNDPPHPSPFTTPRPNFLIVIWESASARAFESLGGVAGVTPGFDSLAASGILFRQFYAAADRTDKGVAATLSAFPAVPRGSILTTPSKTTQLPSLSGALERLGYSTGFYYGGDLEFASLKAYLISAGFDRRIGQGEFPRDTWNSKWGAHDSVVAERLLADLDTQREPFMVSWLTLSSHEPFELPGQPHQPGADWQDRYFATMRYTDRVIASLARRGAERPWWRRTVVVIVADHGRRVVPLDAGAALRSPDAEYQVPMLWIGGAVRARDSVVDQVVSQLDITPTLLDAIGDEGWRQFRFGRTLLRGVERPFAYYGFDEGFGIVTQGGALVQDDRASQETFSRGTIGAFERTLGRALLQLSYQEYLDR